MDRKKLKAELSYILAMTGCYILFTQEELYGNSESNKASADPMSLLFIGCLRLDIRQDDVRL
jgi:hypothetical protein